MSGDLRKPVVDELVVTIVVDNTTDTLSSVQAGLPVLPEMAYLLSGPMTSEHNGHGCVVTLDKLCFACHGFSALATAGLGGIKGTVLFDVGPDGDLWLA